eukprot:GHRQ01031353.1.p1 GENE.GHRQ01031353.1~~GHRQ01031353.1.p1  ORF type:complete len:155 (+),score=12.22 GHRQ01031353.1:989-1453(+)
MCQPQLLQSLDVFLVTSPVKRVNTWPRGLIISSLPSSLGLESAGHRRHEPGAFTIGRLLVIRVPRALVQHHLHAAQVFVLQVAAGSRGGSVSYRHSAAAGVVFVEFFGTNLSQLLKQLICWTKGRLVHECKDQCWPAGKLNIQLYTAAADSQAM